MQENITVKSNYIYAQYALFFTERWLVGFYIYDPKAFN